ncbi:aromatic ring-hydroxylating oxygenase subunit alpha [Rhodococcus erythropolis]|uniref:aromatic ring-hydroxylating oxygenase subunit alpha n=1 Tax=Rhodococcus erythropolis TaxID=1833 RepID=UPI001BEB9BFB|nr:aromatic ring-hydroxylating dioxygenase subunit alpha [Rhodococcus erythropolis]MBT2268965.1 aromatic ring-hydroxylating dioxygenase subunit alpha [Rhodococcus erythropolis]
MTVDNDYLNSLVDWADGHISPEIFVDEEIYRAELEKLFGRSWLFLAHDSMIPNANDFFSTYMGSDPVLVIRQADGGVKAFLNVCRHRGMKVCRAEDGNARTFMCTYHGWTYDSAGKLVNVPNQDDAYFGELKLEDNGLVEIAQVASYKGLIFGNFDSDAPPLNEYLGDLKYYIDGWVDHADGGIEVLPGVIKWTINANWKLAAEQFVGDTYHAPISHASSLLAFGPAFSGKDGAHVSMREGHGENFLFQRHTRFSDDPLADYNEERKRIARERVGNRADMVANFTAFPNFSGLPGSANIRVWHPKGPGRFEIWSFTVVDKNAPEEAKRAQKLSAGFTEGAAGVVETDDGENWGMIGGILQQGNQARKLKWNYEMGVGKSRTHEEFPGKYGDSFFGEEGQRGFYRRWLEFMTSEKWPHIEEDDDDLPLMPSAIVNPTQ